MIYVYFDKNGDLKEVVNNSIAKKGSSNIDGIAVYCELFDESEYSLDDIWYVQKFPDGTLSTEVSFFDTATTMQLPYSKNVDYKFFKDYTDYKFYVMTFTTSLLNQNGLNLGTIRLVFNESIIALGTITFNVQNNVVKNDNNITQSQYDYLITLLSDKDKTFNNVVINENLSVLGNTNIVNLKTSNANIATLEVGAIDGDLIPSKTDTYNLGNDAKAWWKKLYLAGDIHMNGAINMNAKKILASDKNQNVFLYGSTGLIEMSQRGSILRNSSTIEMYAKEAELYLGNGEAGIRGYNGAHIYGDGLGHIQANVGGSERIDANNTEKEAIIFVCKNVENEQDIATFGVSSEGKVYYNGYEISRLRENNAVYRNRIIINDNPLNSDVATHILENDLISFNPDTFKISAINGSLSGTFTYNNSEIINGTKFDKDAVVDFNMSLDNSTGILSVELLNTNGDVLANASVDFPTETMVVDARFDESTNSLILVLQNGNEISVPIGAILKGLVSTEDFEKAVQDLNTRIDETNARIDSVSKEKVYVKDEILYFIENESYVEDEIAYIVG